jgi:hypothetical protein
MTLQDIKCGIGNNAIGLTNQNIGYSLAVLEFSGEKV